MVMFWVVRLFWGERPAWGLEFPGSGRGIDQTGQCHALGQVHSPGGRVPALHRGWGAGAGTLGVPPREQRYSGRYALR